MKYSALLLIILTFSASAAASHASHLKYIRQGSSQDIQTRAEAGIAMMGGGDDLDEAFRWLCFKANGGDFLILRAHGDADYNPYVSGLCQMNSVATRRRPVTLCQRLEGNAGSGGHQRASRRRQAHRRHQRRTRRARPIRLRLPRRQTG